MANNRRSLARARRVEVRPSASSCIPKRGIGLPKCGRAAIVAAVAVAASLALGASTAPATSGSSIVSGWATTSSIFAADAPPLVSYGAAGYRFKRIEKDADPGGFFAEGYDDSAWDVGQAPFGNAGSCRLSFATDWASDTALLVRRRFTVPADTGDVEVHVKVDNDVTVYVNGHPVPGPEPQRFANDGCADHQNVPTIDVAAELLNPGADNVIALHAVDRGVETHLDLEVTPAVDPSPDVTPPASSATPAGCGDDNVRVTVVDEDGGSGPKAVHFKLDGGPEDSTPTASDGTATIPVPEGSHEVEYWGEDNAGNVEPVTPAHKLTVLVDRIGPAVTIISDQGRSAYSVGEPASISVTASDGGSGLDPAHDPTASGESISTAEPGEHVVTKTARDLCGNATAQELRYTVVARRQLTVVRTGSGTVSGSGIECGPVCTATYDDGALVTLRAEEEAGHRFIGWRGAGCAGTGDCSLTIHDDKTVEAIFVKAGPLTWSLARDFRTSFDGPAANPIGDANGIPGVWSLGHSDSGDLDAVRTPPRYGLLRQRKTDANQSLVWWTPGNLGTEISMPENEATFTTWPHIVHVTPYGDRLQVVGWRSPVTGHVRVEGGLTGAPGGDGVRWFVTREAAELARGAVDGGICETQSFADGTGGAALAEIAVTAGETLYFVVDPRGPGGTNAGPDVPTLDVNISEVEPGAPPPVSGRWELAHDLRRAPIQQNDNLDSYGHACAWRFEQGAGVSHDATTKRLQRMTATLGGAAGLEAWTGTEIGAGNLPYPLIGMNTGAERVFQSFTVPSGKAIVHPSPTRTAIVRWRSPFTGYVKVTGAATHLDPNGGDGTLWTIDRNTTTLAEGSAYQGSQAFSAGTGGAALTEVRVTKGDTLAFIVAPGAGGYDYDTTQLDVLIERIPAPGRKLTVVLDPAAGGDVASGDNPKTIDCGATCQATYPHGIDVVLTATPKAGWKLARWEGACVADGACEVTMDADRNVTAVFERIQRRLTAVVFGSGKVTLPPHEPVCSSTCHEDYVDGEVVTITAVPASGWRLMSWSGACSGQVLACAVTMDADRGVRATFEEIAPLRYRLIPGVYGTGSVVVTANVNPPKVTICVAITCGAYYPSGTAFVVEAKPTSPDHHFLGWAQGPCAGSLAPECAFTLTGNMTPAASFGKSKPRPVIGRTAVAKVLGGSVSYRPPAASGSAARAAQAGAEGELDAVPFLPLDPRIPIPVGSTVDATKGALRLTVQKARGGRDTIDLSRGMFVFSQSANGRQRGRTLLKLTTPEPDPCAAAGASGLLQRLKAAGGGAFVVRGRLSESTSRRAAWTTEDRCEGTKTRVGRGRVTVRELATRRAVTLRAGRSHTVRARRR